MASASTGTRPRLGRNGKSETVGTHGGRVAGSRPRVMTNRVARDYTKAKNLVRRHPRASSAILLVTIGAIGLIASVLFKMAARSRAVSRSPITLSADTISEFLTSLRQ